MRAVRDCGAVLVAVAVVLLCAVPADATRLRGYTARGLNVRIDTDATGAATYARFNWHVRRCDSRLHSYADSTVVDSKSAPAARFVTGNPYTVRSPGGVRSRVTVHTTARKVSTYLWKGTFRAFVTVRRHGRVVDRCGFRRIRWTAATELARLDLSSDRYDPILQGKSYSYLAPPQRIDVTGGRYEVDIYAGPWRLAISHRTLRPGHYRSRLAPGRGIDLSGDGRGCDEASAEFTITRTRFDHRGVKAISFSFAQHCEGGRSAARGTFTYRRSPADHRR
jgi:hypothetical protein